MHIFSCGGLCYHVGPKVIIWSQRLLCGVMLLRGANISMKKLMLSCGTKCYHVGPNAIMRGQILSCGTKCYHVGQNVIIRDQMLSCGTMWDHVGLLVQYGQFTLESTNNSFTVII
jgi:hypothetical protein